MIARALEEKGVTSDRCEINRQIKADNKLLRELKAQIERLMKAIRNTISAIAEAMETVRQNMLIFRYQLLHTRASKQIISDTLSTVLPEFRKYTEIVNHLKDKIKERRNLLAEKKATPILHADARASGKRGGYAAAALHLDEKAERLDGVWILDGHRISPAIHRNSIDLFSFPLSF